MKKQKSITPFTVAADNPVALMIGLLLQLVPL